jgi:hypothetical protein
MTRGSAGVEVVMVVEPVKGFLEFQFAAAPNVEGFVGEGAGATGAGLIRGPVSEDDTFTDGTAVLVVEAVVVIVGGRGGA